MLAKFIWSLIDSIISCAHKLIEARTKNYWPCGKKKISHFIFEYTPASPITNDSTLVLANYRGVSDRRAGRRSAPAADSPREIWWTISRNYTVLFSSRDAKNTKFKQYLLVDLTSLNVPNSRFQKPVMFWRWRHHGIVTSRRWYLTQWFEPMTASNATSLADVANARDSIVASGWYGKFRTADHGLAMGRITV